MREADSMFIALDQKGQRVTIEEAIEGVQYMCPTCNSNLIQRRGTVNIHHFAHAVGGDCDTWSEMTEWHLEWQNQFNEQYREITLGEHRADIKMDNYIIEFQHSPISEEDLRERIDFYTRYGKLIFLFDLREKTIYRNKHKSNTFIWKYPSRTIIPPNNKNYFLFFQVADNTILFIKGNLDNWSEFEVYKTLNKVQFFSIFNKNNNLDILKALYEEKVVIEAKEDDLKRQRRLWQFRITGLEKEIVNMQEKYDKSEEIYKSNLNSYKQEVIDLNKRVRKQHDHINELKKDIRKVKKGKIVEKIVEVEVPVIKEVQVEKLVPLNRKKVVDAVLLELGRYVSCGATYQERERAYPRQLFETRIIKMIDEAYGLKVSC